MLLHDKVGRQLQSIQRRLPANIYELVNIDLRIRYQLITDRDFIFIYGQGWFVILRNMEVACDLHSTYPDNISIRPGRYLNGDASFNRIFNNRIALVGKNLQRDISLAFGFIDQSNIRIWPVCWWECPISEDAKCGC